MAKSNTNFGDSQNSAGKNNGKYTQDEKNLIDYLIQLYSQVPTFFSKKKTVDENCDEGKDICLEGYLNSHSIFPSSAQRCDEINVIALNGMIEEMEERKRESDYEHLAILVFMRDYIKNIDQHLL